MKKILIVPLLTLAFCTAGLYAMEERAISQKENDALHGNVDHTNVTIDIVCKDGALLNISGQDFQLLKQASSTISDLITHAEPGPDNKIYLEFIDQEVLIKIINILKSTPATFEESEKQIEQFSQESLILLLKLLKGAFFLNIEHQVVLFSKALACTMVGMSPQQFVEFCKNLHLEPELKRKIAIYMICHHPASTLYMSVLHRTLKTASKENGDRSVKLSNLVIFTALAVHPEKLVCAVVESLARHSTVRVSIINLKDNQENDQRSHWDLGRDEKTPKLIFSRHYDLAVLSDKYIHIIPFNYILSSNTIVDESSIHQSRRKKFMLDKKQACTIATWNSEASRLAVGYDDGTLYILERLLNNEWTLIPLKGHFQGITSLEWTSAGDRSILSSCDRNAKNIEWTKSEQTNEWFFLATFQRTNKPTDHTKHPYITTTPTHSTDKNAISLTFKNLKERTLLHWHTMEAKYTATRPDGSLLASASDREICLWRPLYNYFSTSRELTIEQAFIITHWYDSKRTNKAFKIPKELSDAYGNLPYEIKIFFENKHCPLSIKKD